MGKSSHKGFSGENALLASVMTVRPLMTAVRLGGVGERGLRGDGEWGVA